MDTLTTPPVVTGTSLAVLAPYLPYGIEVETSIDDGERERKQLHSLTQDGYPRTRLYGREEAELFTDMLPVLRAFSALCDKLSDGTVPALALASILFGDALDPTYKLDAGFDHFGNAVVIANGCRLYCIWQYWAIDCEDGTAVGPEAYDYLRSQHFALPVNGRPLVEGVDFIAKL